MTYINYNKLGFDNKLKNNNSYLTNYELFPRDNDNFQIRNDFDLKLPYKRRTNNSCIPNFGEYNDNINLQSKLYSPPTDNIQELCEMFDVLYSSGDDLGYLDQDEIKKLRTLCIILEQSNNDLEYVTKRLDHENKCFDPRINQLKSINKTLKEDNIEYFGRSVENRFLLKDVEKLKELLDALTSAVNEEVNNHCKLQEEYFAAEFNRKQFERDRMVYELTSAQTSHQLNNLSLKKAHLENCKEDLMKKQVYVNRLQDIKGFFRVFARIRMFQNKNTESIFSFVTDDKIGIKSLKTNSKTGDEVKVYQFNKIFNNESSHIDISNNFQGSINQLIVGYNVCLIHFGTSGSGKTHTVVGDFQSECGISTFLVGKLIDEMNKEHRKRFKIDVSFLEFYNDNLICLLSEKKIKLKDTGKKILIDDYVKESIITLNNYNRLLQQVAQKRQTSATSFCSQSSRSHLIIIISIKSENTITFVKTNSRLIICDLAGFEKTSVNIENMRKQYMDETYYINNSLSVLSQIIEEFNLYKLKHEHLTQRKSTLPFRSSKLTQFLKPCFFGDAYCYLIIHVSNDPVQIHSTCKILQLGQTAMSTELGKPICHKTDSGSICLSKYIR